MSDQNQQELIKFKEHKKPDNSVLLEIELNNSKKMNVLNLEIMFALNEKIKKWQNKKELSSVFIHSAGDKAFCAGGDIVQIYSTILESRKKGEDPALAAKDFFRTEYGTDYMLFHFPKPVVLWGNGVVMGGGLGLFMASSYPIVTETSLMAMPEISIGFFPDVGASYFLNQIKEDIGRYLALTGCRLNAAEACYLNLTKWAFSQKEKQNVFDFLIESSFSSREEFDNQFKNFYERHKLVLEQDNWIKSFKKEISKALEFKDLKSFYNYMLKAKLEDKRWEKNRKSFFDASPTSLAVIFEQLRRAKDQKDIKAIFEMEVKIAMHKARNADFPEGIRALLIDKTKNPQWKPNHIGDLDPLEIERYFTALEGWDCSLNM